VASRADILLTSNGRDFGDADLLPYEIYTPDEFFLLVDDSAPEQVRRVTLKQVKYWEAKEHRGENVKPLNVALADAGCNEFATRVRLHLQTLAGPRKPRHR
jgi:hypothetical protein